MVEGRFRLGDETLLCYTDGATEALNESGEEFGSARLIEAVREHQGLTPHRMVRALFRSLREFAGETAQRDDTTFLAVKRGR
jgi:sigma-B regulation protein RsbU (phosphoserine phosphatase)